MNKTYYERNKKKVKQYAKQYYEKNYDKVSCYNRKYYMKRKCYIIEYVIDENDGFEISLINGKRKRDQYNKRSFRVPCKMIEPQYYTRKIGDLIVYSNYKI
jgi:hypothetical protein